MKNLYFLNNNRLKINELKNMDNKINNYPKKSKIQKEIVLKTQENYNLYTTYFKQVFENINYYISKKIHIIRKFKKKRNYIEKKYQLIMI